MGAILTQRTNWKNVELALGNLTREKMNSLKALCQLGPEKLAYLIKPAGFYQAKARYLFHLAQFVIEKYGGVEEMKKAKLKELREELLKLKGVGFETADSILLYDLDKPVFVIDEYTKRLLKEKNLLKNKSYHFLQKLFEENLRRDFRLYQDFHALIVIDGKNSGVKSDKIVLVSVLKARRDFNALLTENWYRIPVRHAPRREFNYLAFYQPAPFGQEGKCIQYYAPVLNEQIVKRSDLLPEELNHPRAKDYYLKIQVGKAKKLSRPIRNIIPRRISFGFTTLSHLLESKDILQLYNITPTEQMVEDGLKSAGIKISNQHYVSDGKKRYFLDFAVFCQKGKLAIECDNRKAHSILAQKKKDKIKDAFLRRHGWAVIRLAEDDIVSDLKGCIEIVRKTIQKLGGIENKVEPR